MTLQKRTGKPSESAPDDYPKTRSHLAWSDFEVVLAVAVAGSLSGASRAMGVSHATVFRRLGDIEKRLGVALFERSRTGYRPTPAGEELAETAKVMDQAACEKSLGVTWNRAGKSGPPPRTRC